MVWEPLLSETVTVRDRYGVGTAIGGSGYDRTPIDTIAHLLNSV